MTNIRLTVKHGCSHAQPCSGASLGMPLPPRCRGRGAHSSTWAIICPREGGGGGVGAAASSRWQMLASQSKMAARAPGRALACLSNPACHPDTEGRARTLRLGLYYLASGGRRRRCRGGGELPVANARLTVQDGGSRPRPCSGVPLVEAWREYEAGWNSTTAAPKYGISGRTGVQVDVSNGGIARRPTDTFARAPIGRSD